MNLPIFITFPVAGIAIEATFNICRIEAFYPEQSGKTNIQVGGDDYTVNLPFEEVRRQIFARLNGLL